MINMTDAVYLYITTTFDSELALLDPPLFSLPPAHADPSLMNMLVAAGRRAAERHDRYHQIKQVALLAGDHVQHMVLGDKQLPVITVDTKLRAKPSTVKIYADEGELIHDLWLNIMSAAPSVIVGWALRNQWALLVNKSLCYNIPIAAKYKQDPLKRYPTVECLLDVQSIYLQGISPAVRVVPDLIDTLNYWDMLKVDAAELPQVKEIMDAPASAWETGDMARKIELYLEGLRAAVTQYYNDDSEYNDMHYMPRESCSSIRGPQPKDNSSQG